MKKFKHTNADLEMARIRAENEKNSDSKNTMNNSTRDTVTSHDVDDDSSCEYGESDTDSVN